MKILVVFTGGTIGSTSINGYVSPDGKKPYYLLELYNKRKKNDIVFETICPYETLSENMTCYTLFRLVNILKDKLKKDYDGIIVTHGTDTLQYTAATLSYTLGSNTIPVVLVSSNYVLNDKRANGLDNFYYAVEFICSQKGRGVFVSYKNTGDVPKIHRASRLLEHPVYSDDLDSLGGICYGSFDNDKFIQKSSYTAGDESGITLGIPDDNWSSDIMMIRPYPGMRYTIPDKSIKGILHLTYHSGTICSLTPGIKDFAVFTNSHDIPVFLAGTGKGADYESTKVYEELGFNKLPYSAPIAMYIKLWLTIRNNLPVIDTMNKCIGEDFPD